MPGFDGIYVGNELKKQNESAIIFIVTSHLEYLDAAMRFHVFRYLSKPIDKQRLFQNLDDALELYYSINQKIAVETKSGVTSVLTCDIVYVEAKGRKVIVHTATADLDSTQTLQFWIDHLPEEYWKHPVPGGSVSLSTASLRSDVFFDQYHVQFSFQPPLPAFPEIC